MPELKPTCPRKAIRKTSQANVIALSFSKPELWAVEVCIAGMGIFDCDIDLDLNPMTFILEPDPYCLEVHLVC